jgi:serine/threonine protein kinase
MECWAHGEYLSGSGTTFDKPRLSFGNCSREKKMLSAAYKGQPSYPQLVAEMIAVMGKPPATFLQRSLPEVRQRWVNDAGEWSCTHPEVKVPRLQLEEEEKVLKDAEVDNTPFLRFLRRILVWEPERRATASELLADPWLASFTPSLKLL